MTRESEYCESGIESKVGPDRWVCIWELSDVTIHRTTSCERYNICLNEAVEKEWTGFSCRNCPKYKREELKNETNL